MPKLSRFTDSGLKEFEAYIDKARKNGQIMPPFHLLEDPNYCKKFGVAEFVVPIFESKAQLGKWISEVLGEESIKYMSDKHFWSWVGLLLFDQICPPDAEDNRKVGQSTRYILDAPRSSYRHLVWQTWWVEQTFGENGYYLLKGMNPNAHAMSFQGGEVMGQIGANQLTTASITAINMGRLLYENPETGRQKKGTGGKGPGSPRRFVAVMKQLALTFDHGTMTIDRLKELLPYEFSAWLKS